MFSLKNKPLRKDLPYWRKKSPSGINHTTYTDSHKAVLRKPVRLPIESMKGFLYRHRKKKRTILASSKNTNNAEERGKRKSSSRVNRIRILPSERGSAMESVLKIRERMGQNQMPSSKYSSVNIPYSRGPSQPSSALNGADRKYRSHHVISYRPTINSKKMQEASCPIIKQYRMEDTVLEDELNGEVNHSTRKKRRIYKGKLFGTNRLHFGLGFLPFVRNKDSIYSDKQSSMLKSTHSHLNPQHTKVTKSKIIKLIKMMADYLFHKFGFGEEVGDVEPYQSDFLHDAKAFKLEELDCYDDDEEFNLSTLPTQAFNQAVSKFNIEYNLDERKIVDNITESKFILNQDIQTLRDSDIPDKMKTYAMILRASMKSPELQNDSFLMSKATQNMFSLVTDSLMGFNDEDDISDNIQLFFKTVECVQDLFRRQRPDETSREIVKKNVKNSSIAINSMLANIRPKLDYISFEDRKTLLFGYIQHLFFIFYDILGMSFGRWKKRLMLVNYTHLTIPRNIEMLISCAKFQKFIFSDNEFIVLFRRFYTSILTLILKSEFIRTQDMYIWQFILDCYGLHFILQKYKRFYPYCEEIWSFNEKINSENILLRYIISSGQFPTEVLLSDKIQKSIIINFAALAKHYENIEIYKEGRITFIHQGIVQKMFDVITELISRDYSNEKLQLNILGMMSSILKVLGNYISYNFYFGSQEVLVHSILPFRMSFNELLYRLQTKKTMKHNSDRHHQIIELILKLIEVLDRLKKKPKKKKAEDPGVKSRFQKSKKTLAQNLTQLSGISSPLLLNIDELSENSYSSDASSGRGAPTNTGDSF